MNPQKLSLKDFVHVFICMQSLTGDGSIIHCYLFLICLCTEAVYKVIQYLYCVVRNFHVFIFEALLFTIQIGLLNQTSSGRRLALA